MMLWGGGILRTTTPHSAEINLMSSHSQLPSSSSSSHRLVMQSSNRGSVGSRFYLVASALFWALQCHYGMSAMAPVAGYYCICEMLCAFGVFDSVIEALLNGYRRRTTGQQVSIMVEWPSATIRPLGQWPDSATLVTMYVPRPTTGKSWWQREIPAVTAFRASQVASSLLNKAKLCPYTKNVKFDVVEAGALLASIGTGLRCHTFIWENPVCDAIKVLTVVGPLVADGRLDLGQVPTYEYVPPAGISVPNNVYVGLDFGTDGRQRLMEKAKMLGIATQE
eukprot:GHVQ01009337.1.p1 GENE.GHVQ01009337.1~~GHVQ01009337.1.p1  ORF type:complete len:279 (+),score=32.63 GHVQ01009337.1:430-1266(+)